MNLTLSYISEKTGMKLVGPDMTVNNLIINSKEASNGCIFAVFKGEKTDAMQYVPELDEKYEMAYLADRPVKNAKNPYLLTDDVLKSVGDIAKLHIETCTAKKIAVTGSVGKTTTKNFIVNALSECMKVHYANGNRNNELGMPLTALETPPDAKAIVLEMGMRGMGQIKYLCNIAKPDVSVITNIGISHIELLGSRENILKAKLEIAEALPDDGTLILNGDDDMLCNVKTDKKTLLYGINNPDCDVRAVNVVDNKFTLRYNGCEYPVTLSILGEHNVYNALAAVSTGIALGCDIKSLVNGVEKFKGDGSRQNIYTFGPYRIFDDTYNASPASMNASMSVMTAFDGRRVLVLGDMLELGSESVKSHTDLAETVKRIDAKLVICIGNEMKHLYNALSDVEKYSCMTNSEALEILNKTAKPGDNILFKGSNSMNLKGLLADFKEGK